MEDINSEGLLWKQADVPKVIEKMRREQVDALFFPHCNFGSEGVVGQVAAALNVPVLLYGPRDDAGVGWNEDRDSQCGLFATGKVCDIIIQRLHILQMLRQMTGFLYQGYEKFLRVVQVVKTVRNIAFFRLVQDQQIFLA